MKATWIVVANRARAVVLLQRGQKQPPRVLDTIEHPEGRMHEHEMKSDGPGQSYDSRGVVRHAYSSHESPTEHETKVFAKALAHKLAVAADKQQFEGLILIAAPDFLGVLRNELSPTLAKRVASTINKDIAGRSEPEICTLAGALLANQATNASLVE